MRKGEEGRKREKYLLNRGRRPVQPSNKKNRTIDYKWAGPEQVFSQGRHTAGNRQMKRHSTSLSAREMQTKTTKRPTSHLSEWPSPTGQGVNKE